MLHKLVISLTLALATAAAALVAGASARMMPPEPGVVAPPQVVTHLPRLHASRTFGVHGLTFVGAQRAATLVDAGTTGATHVPGPQL